MNKKWLILIAVLGLTMLPLMAQGYGNGHGKGGNKGGYGGGGNGDGNGDGNGNAMGPAYNLLDGTPFSFSGTVVEVGTFGSGITVSTIAGNITVTGLGPNRYWFNLNLTKPVIGDTVSGKGYTVNYNETVRNVMTEITVNGNLVPLRDENGLPLWRGQGRRGFGHGGGGGFGGDYSAILNGTPFTFEGDVVSDYAAGYGRPGNGLEIATAGGNVTVRGLGPNYYWDQLGIAKPALGDTVQAIGFTVDFNGNIVNILMSIVLEDGTTVQLRDAETGAPLWRGSRRQ